MTEPRCLLLEEREGGNTVLVGGWPEFALIDPLDLPELSPHARPGQLRIGDDFIIEVSNGRAQYRYVERRHREMLCFKIKAGHAHASISATHRRHDPSDPLSGDGHPSRPAVVEG